MVLRPLGSDLSSIIIAVKIQVSKINYYKINVFHELCGIRYRQAWAAYCNIRHSLRLYRDNISPQYRFSK